LFSDEDQYKKIKVLSGGEKSRVALAKTLISDANFLLLDEPTNHLDFISENILIQALQQYQGSYIVVSHNRHFIAQIANKIWYIDNHEIKEYPGTYDEYEYWRKQQAEKIIEVKMVEKPKVAKKEIQPTPANEARKKTLAKEIKKLEELVANFEKEKNNLEVELTKEENYTQIEKVKELQKALTNIMLKLEETNTQWFALAEELESL